MKKILVIDNNIDPPHGCKNIVGHLENQKANFDHMEITVCRGPENAPQEYEKLWDGVVISGSKTRILDDAPWIDRQMQFIHKLFDKKIPTFGICYGEQIIVRSLLGKKYTGPAKKSEFGWIEIKKTQTNDENFLKELPNSFYSFSFHKDEVKNLPDSFRILAQSNDCQVQAYEIKNVPFIGVQFHPEKSLQETSISLTKLKQRDPQIFIHNADQGATHYNEALAKKIFFNFLKKVWNK